MSSKDVRSAILGIGIIFCIGLLAMTVVVVGELEVREWNFSFLLLGAFVVFGVAIIGMILVALISALRNPPDE